VQELYTQALVLGAASHRHADAMCIALNLIALLGWG
jgi:hypothetical protein